ncbi:hypothetical protein [Streptomyces sviceus]|uniref:hypothetical protein n=1 Tax=Streptomyces sviceus TaxID=285530 RepID=UPI0033322871
MGMLNASAQQPGFLGGGVLVDGEAEWHVVYRFASEGTVRSWEDSTARARWDVQAADFARQTGRRSVRGYKVWFDSQTATPKTPAPPAEWKLWFVNMSAVFPPALMFNLIIFLLCLCVTALVTWILMPRLQRFLKKWLYPPLPEFRGRDKRWTA